MQRYNIFYNHKSRIHLSAYGFNNVTLKWSWRDCFFDRNCFDAIAYIIVYQYYTK